MLTAEKINACIRTIPDFPKPGIHFKDITPLLQNSALCEEIIEDMAKEYKNKIDVICGIESRGFFFGFGLACKLHIPFVPIRKEGKLPFHKIRQAYDLEYGNASIEIHRDAFTTGSRVLVHDDLLATGGTAHAAAQMINTLGGNIYAFSFIIELVSLAGQSQLAIYNVPVHSLVKY